MELDWFIIARSATASVGLMLRQTPPQEKLEPTGTRGEGGDMTLNIDARAEQAVFDELDKLSSTGVRFTAISEERGEVDYGSRELLVIIDPIDGSLNAKRGLPQHSISIAVADGPTMADVVFGYVFDFGTGEEWVAERGRGAFLASKPLARDRPERRDDDGRLELLGIESADPRLIRAAADGLAGAAHRVRALGSIAITLCQVAGGRMEGMVTLRASRAVDTAAGQLIVREAGGSVTFPGASDPLAAPLDVDAHFPIVAARSPESLGMLAAIPSGE